MKRVAGSASCLGFTALAFLSAQAWPATETAHHAAASGSDDFNLAEGEGGGVIPNPTGPSQSRVLGPPSLRARPDGTRVVVYTVGSSILALLLDSDSRPLGPPIVVKEPGPSAFPEPALTLAANGGFFVVWTEAASLAGPTSPRSILARGFNADGDPTTPVLVVDSGELPEADLGEPDVSADERGNVTVVWVREGRILSRRFREGGLIAEPIVAISDDLHVASRPVASSNALGETVVAWYRTALVDAARLANGGPSDDATSIVSRRFDPNGAPLEPEQPIEITDEPDFDVLIDSLGEVLAFVRPARSDRIVARRLARDGRQRLSSHEIARGPGVRRPRAAINTAGSYAVTWEDGVAGGASRQLVAVFDRTGSDLRPATVVREGAASGDVAIPNRETVTVVYLFDQGRTRFLNGFRDTVPLPSTPCEPAPGQLCFADGRIQVQVAWASPGGLGGVGGGVPVTTDTGLFWFFSENNLEIAVKVIDACAINGRYWLFAGGLTDLLTQLLVTDTTTGITASYLKTSSVVYPPIRDLETFLCVGDSLSSGRSEAHGVALASTFETLPLLTTEGCMPGAEALCLGGRFEVALDWLGEEGAGVGRAFPLNDDNGAFWFFEPDNVEVFVKVLDGCRINGRRWVFAAGLTDLGTLLRVRDVVTGETRTYAGSRGAPFQSILDLESFASCP